ncbi:hypothetical protein Q1M63_30240 [Sinorhizobium meliloti]|jgi:hypothetical protein|nr:hypothetical protein Q1M63_30240 [Sinorhizobium meliloti]
MKPCLLIGQQFAFEGQSWVIRSTVYYGLSDDMGRLHEAEYLTVTPRCRK